MNTKLFDNLMKHPPIQCRPEWLMFLEICEKHLEKHSIKNPIVVELGVYRDRQKRFYEQLLGASHIGINIKVSRSVPDILGDSHNLETLKMLKEKLGGKPINILFIDASHTYESIKKDFEMYSPLCSDIVALHDIENGRHKNDWRNMVWKFWDELSAKAYVPMGGYENFLFLSIHQCVFGRKKTKRQGIGVMIKR